jgi:molecular chaperone GrpE
VTKDKDKTLREDEIKDNEIDASEEDLPEEQPTPTPEDKPEGEESEAAEAETVEDELARVKSEAAEYLDGWQRARAEFANYKKRIERENEEARQRITSEILLRYLSIMDDLERALGNGPNGDDLDDWVSGIELIYQKFEALLEAEGVEPIETEGERFDPNLHEAISYEESEEYEGGSIIAVTQRGYKLGDRIIRPAMVRVAK